MNMFHFAIIESVRASLSSGLPILLQEKTC